MKAKMILKKGMVFLFAMVMVLTGIFSLGVMAASGLEGAYISPKSKMGLQYANNFSRDVSKSQVSVPNFMADSDTNGEEPNKSFNAQQVAAGNSDAGQKWRGFAAYAKNHDPSDFWVKYKNVTTANGKSVDLKIEVTDWKTQNDESKPLPSNGDMFGHDNNSAHLGYAIGFSYKKTGVVMFSGFKWVKFKYTFLYNGTKTKAPFTGFATFQDIDQNQYVTITDGTECISKASYIGGSDGNTWCEPDGWTYKAIKDQNASSDMGKDTFNKTCISLYVKDMTDMSIKYGWTGHTAIAYFDLAPWAMNSFEDNANPDVPKKLIQSGSSWISNEKTSAVAYKLGDTYSYRYEDTTPTYATDILSNLWNGQNKTAISSYVWEDTLDSGLSYVAGSLQVNVGGEDFTSEFSDSSSGQNIKFSATSKALANTSFYGKKVTVTFKVKIKDSSYNWLGHERTADNKYRLIPNTAKRSMTYLKKLAYDDKKEVYTVTDGDYTSIPQNTSTVWSKVPIGDPDNPDPDPKKTVSDEDEKNVLNNTLTNADETFTYTVSKEIEKNMPSTAKYSKVVIKDDVDSCLTIDSVKFYAGDKDVTSSFAPTSANKGNYLEYSQFEKIPLSAERQRAVLESQIDEIEKAIALAKEAQGENYTVKQMVKSRKNLEVRLEKLNEKKKDDVVTFEELGVDRLFVDESHGFKNLFLYTKMRNVAGVAQSESQKAMDMYNKCRYMDEITGGKGITFATGTPVSNSMTELYTIQRYLQYDRLQEMNLGMFDSWASIFGETVTAMELSPEGNGYRMKTRFANFFNLPELMSVFQEVADIQTSDMLQLPVPEAEYENVVLPASEEQKEILQSISERADRVRNREVDPSEDNMLKITTDGRKLALDQRLINDMLPDTANNKVSACAERCFKVWQETKEQKSAQLVFCDTSTPKKDGSFNVYDALEQKLIEKGVPEEEIAFIHDANTDRQKAVLFSKVRSGQIRFLFGSTSKMGAGTNVQDRLIALHHLDVPWRPADIEQQEGRILRQGNKNKKVKIFRYIVENTFDAYMWQILENKQKFISQIMTSKSPVRSCQDVDAVALSYAETKALATGNPKIKEKMELDVQVTKLKMLKANYESNLFRLQDAIAVEYPQRIAKYEELTAAYEADIAHLDTVLSRPFSIEIQDINYNDEKAAGEALVQACTNMKKEHTDAANIGTFKGFKMKASYSLFDNSFYVKLTRESSVSVEIKKDPVKNIERILTALKKMPGQKAVAEERLEDARQQFAQAKEEVQKPFDKEDELKYVQNRLTKINAELDMEPKTEPKLVKKEELKKCL